jgi:AmiR/NasT family two-component response regulator
MLMMLNGISEDDAFELLRRHSQTLNIKLADVARAIIKSRGELSGGDEAPPAL